LKWWLLARKKKKEEYLIEKLLKKADEARRTGIELSRVAAEQAQQHGRRLQRKGVKRIEEGISAAKKFRTSTDEDLKTLEKLGKLKKSGIITDKEFQAKKKQILARL